MDDENTLRLKAREAIQAGRLPRRRAERMWGGPGFGVCCAVCSNPVNGDELGFELDFARDGEAPGLSNSHIHIPCFAAWELELQKVEVSVLPPASNDGTISACERDTTYRSGPV